MEYLCAALDPMLGGSRVHLHAADRIGCQQFDDVTMRDIRAAVACSSAFVMMALDESQSRRNLLRQEP
jgi:hypothetical protein